MDHEALASAIESSPACVSKEALHTAKYRMINSSGEEAARHGDHHPAVSIRVDSTPLVSRHRASDGGRGQWPTRGTMELTFYLQGAVPHFAYRIVVQEIDASNHQVVRQQEETGVVMGEDASSQPVTVTFWILDAEQSAYRFMIAAWDAYEGLKA